MKLLTLLFVSGMSIASLANASANVHVNVAPIVGIDELNPFDPNIEQILNQMDQDYRETTGESPLTPDFAEGVVPDFFAESCYRNQCSVYIRIDKSSQSATL